MASTQNKSQGNTDLVDGSRMTKIDRLWAMFVDWLEHGHSLFAVQGKPGSGKSTLFKFLATHQNTEQSILRWKPNATIYTHFFWKIGSSAQNSIKGLYQNLIYKIVSTNRKIVKRILGQLPRSASHNYPYDWSVEDLKFVLLFILEKNLPMCIFIDGLDEISNHDGLSRLISVIDDMLKIPNIKICVSSRPEVLVVNWLSKKQAPWLLLEDLTRSDMTAFVQGELSVSMKSGCVSERFIERIASELVLKAQGVFLWLHLATRSVASGIEKGDAEEMLLSRLDAMPGELTKLYADMWQRLNDNDPVYRKTAARLFSYVLNGQMGFVPMFPENGRPSGFPEVPMPTLFQIASAENIDTHDSFLQAGRSIDRDKVLQVCDAYRNILQVRCAGLVHVGSSYTQRSLEMAIANIARPRLRTKGRMKLISKALLSRVDFIHRTAHDFLMDTEAGQEILKHGEISSRASRLRLLKGQVCLLRFLRSEYGIMSRCGGLIYQTIDMFKTAVDVEEKHEFTVFLQVLHKFYDEQAFGEEPEWQPQPSFLTHLTDHTELDDFVLSSVAQSGTKDLATDVLRDCWDPDPSLYYIHGRSPSAKLVEGLISLGGDPHAYGLNRARRMGRMEPFARQGTAFSNILQAGLSSIDNEQRLDGPGAREMWKAALIMAATCPDMTKSVLLHIGGYKNGRVGLLNLTWLQSPLRIGDLSLIFEANFGFLLSRMLTGFAKAMDIQRTEGIMYERVLSSLKNTLVKLRLILSRSENQNSPVCHQILLGLFPVSELDAITECVFQSDPASQSEETEKIHKHFELARDNSALQLVDIEAAMISLSQEGVGFCTLSEAQIYPPLSFIENMEKNIAEYPWPLTIGQLRKEVVQHSASSESESIQEPMPPLISVSR